MDLWRALKNLGRSSQPDTQAEPLTPAKVDAGYRLFWMKMAWNWDDARREAVAGGVENVIAADGFEKNTFERRFRVDGLDDLAHSGASLLALREVLAALAAFGDGEPE